MSLFPATLQTFGWSYEGHPYHQQCQGLILEHTLYMMLLSKVKLVILNFFLTPPDIWVELCSHPHSHGDLQHQQG